MEDAVSVGYAKEGGDFRRVLLSSRVAAMEAQWVPPSENLVRHSPCVGAVPLDLVPGG